MQRLNTYCLITAIGWSFVTPILAAEQQFRAGAAKVDITPTSWPVPMVGSFSERLAHQAWDPLHARALVMDDGSMTMAIVVVDSCYCPRSLFDEAKRRIEAATGIPTQHQLMSATHTHTAPASRDRREVRADPEYVELVTQGIADAVADAHARRELAEFGWGVVQVPEEVFNRRWFMKEGGIVPNPFGQTVDKVRMNPPRGSDLLLRPAGPTDPDVTFLSVRSTTGRPVAILANYSLHYVGGIRPGGVSADYFGEFAKLVEEQLAIDEPDAPRFVGMLSNGTSGDINNIDFRGNRGRAEPFERMRAVAGRVADAVLHEYASIDHQTDVSLAMVQREIRVGRRRPTAEQLEFAREVLAAESDAEFPRLARAYARWAVELDEPPFTEELVLQAARIGPVGISAIPCEVFVEIGLELKELSPHDITFTTELANGHYGYLPTPQQHELGGYETWLGTCILETNASETITENLVEMLHEVAR